MITWGQRADKWGEVFSVDGGDGRANGKTDNGNDDGRKVGKQPDEVGYARVRSEANVFVPCFHGTLEVAKENQNR